MFSAGFFSIFINLLMLTGPIFMLQVYDSVLASKSIPTLVALFVLVAVLFVFMGLLDLIRGRILARTGMLFEEQLQHSSFNSVVEHSLRRTPNVSTQPIRDVETIRAFISGGGPAAFFDMPWVPIYLLVIFLFHWTLGVLAVGAAILLFALAFTSELLTRDPIAKAAGATLRSGTLAEEARRNAEVLKSMGMLSAFRARWQSHHNAARAEQMRLNDRIGGVTSTSKSLRMFLQSAMLAAGAALAVQNIISPGVMIAASIILSRALAPVEQSIGHWRGFQTARNSYDRLRQYIGTTPVAAEQMPLPEPEGRVSVEGLIVHLGGDDPALIGVNFQLQPGAGLGVIGATGSGKTTLARALVGGLIPSKGTVRIDGATLGQWPENQLHRVIGYMPQDVELFSGTIRENIARFSAVEDEQSVTTAAKLADVHEMILRLPNGYDTDVGEAGGMISAGQRQRIGLARAVFGLPKVVVLDEPNSNLDGDGEVALVRAVTALRQAGTTVIVIAHRPSGVQAVEQLLFLEKGHQKLFGPKEQVLKALQDERNEKLKLAQEQRQQGQVEARPSEPNSDNFDEATDANVQDMAPDAPTGDSVPAETDSGDVEQQPDAWSLTGKPPKQRKRRKKRAQARQESGPKSTGDVPQQNKDTAPQIGPRPRRVARRSFVKKHKRPPAAE